MTPICENEIAEKDRELARKSEEQSARIKRTDTMSQNKWSNTFTTFVVGVGVGTLVGLLFAPASGKKTRNYIAGNVKHGLDEAASTGKRWSRHALETVADVKANVAGVVAVGEKAFRTARDA